MDEFDVIEALGCLMTEYSIAMPYVPDYSDEFYRGIYVPVFGVNRNVKESILLNLFRKHLLGEDIWLTL